MDVTIEGPSKISLFLYDNGTFIVESYADVSTSVKVNIKSANQTLTEITTGLTYKGINGKSPRIWGRNITDITSFDINLKPHSFKVFQYQ